MRCQTSICENAPAFYKVYHTERRFPPTEETKEARYNIIAIIEFEGSYEEVLKLYGSDEWVAFMDEYMDWLEDDPALYIAHEVPQTDQLEKHQFQARNEER